jgi:fluoride ion exporter CrcB/FEX
MKTVLLVALGGAFGSVARYQISGWLPHGNGLIERIA